MSEKQMRERIEREVEGEKGVLEGFTLVFNKQSKKNPEISFANIINKEDSEVQGAMDII